MGTVLTTPWLTHLHQAISWDPLTTFIFLPVSPPILFESKFQTIKSSYLWWLFWIDTFDTCHWFTPCIVIFSLPFGLPTILVRKAYFGFIVSLSWLILSYSGILIFSQDLGREPCAWSNIFIRVRGSWPVKFSVWWFLYVFITVSCSSKLALFTSVWIPLQAFNNLDCGLSKQSFFLRKYWSQLQSFQVLFLIFYLLSWSETERLYLNTLLVFWSISCSVMH